MLMDDFTVDMTAILQQTQQKWSFATLGVFYLLPNIKQGLRPLSFTVYPSRNIESWQA
jgi:hypothetical protein